MTRTRVGVHVIVVVRGVVIVVVGVVVMVVVGVVGCYCC